MLSAMASEIAIVLVILAVCAAQARAGCVHDSDCIGVTVCKNPANVKCSHHHSCYCDEQCHTDRECSYLTCHASKAQQCRNNHQCACVAVNTVSCSSDEDCNRITCHMKHWKRCNGHHCSCEAAADRGCSHHHCPHGQNVVDSPDGCFCRSSTIDHKLPRVNGGWAYWTPWTQCHGCTGRSSRSRQCQNPLPENGGASCVGDWWMVENCSNSQACKSLAVNGGWTEWTSWSPCSHTCGHGVSFRNRYCTNPAPQNGGAQCVGDQHQRNQCATQNCPATSSVQNNHGCDRDAECHGLNCKTKERCSMQGFCYCDDACTSHTDCGFIRCDSAHYQQCTYGGHCVCAQGPAYCKRHSECSSITCPAGHRQACSHHHHCYCLKDNYVADNYLCHNHTCRADEVPWATKEGSCTCIQDHGPYLQGTATPNAQVVNGGWSHWYVSPCSVTCGHGTQRHFRMCNHPAPANGGTTCVGHSEYTSFCNRNVCPVDGGWGHWSQWGECSVSCGNGQTVRSRACDSPPPSHGGKACVGNATESTVCHRSQCQVDGQWGNWLHWGTCSVSCGDGQRVRYRQCNRPSPSHGGKPCVGQSMESMICHKHACPVVVDGGWGQWSAWGSCSTSCGIGSEVRRRLCDSPYPSGGGETCHGYSRDMKGCQLRICPVNGGWSAWGPYGACSATCGPSVKARQRTCTNPAPADGGLQCPGADHEFVACAQMACPTTTVSTAKTTTTTTTTIATTTSTTKKPMWITVPARVMILTCFHNR